MQTVTGTQRTVTGTQRAATPPCSQLWSHTTPCGGLKPPGACLSLLGPSVYLNPRRPPGCLLHMQYKYHFSLIVSISSSTKPFHTITSRKRRRADVPSGHPLVVSLISSKMAKRGKGKGKLGKHKLINSRKRSRFLRGEE